MSRFRKRNDHGFEAVPAVIVADQTDKLGKRLGLLGVWLLILFFAISASVQSAKNSKMLERADKDRSSLVTSISVLTSTVGAQTQTIKDLKTAIQAQNKLLKDAGINPIVIPGDNATVIIGPTPSPRPGIAPSPQPKPQPQPKPRPSQKPKPSPKPSPSPSPKPGDPAIDAICQISGLCNPRGRFK